MGIDLQAECRKREFYAYGTAQIFHKRMLKYKHLKNIVNYFGLAIPFVVGLFFLSFGSAYQTTVSLIAGSLIILQGVAALWALNSNWDETYYSAKKSVLELNKIKNAWENLARRGAGIKQNEYDKLFELDARQEEADLSQHVSKKEQRYAMRHALYHFGSTCARCNAKPKSLKPNNNCDTCSNF